ncbi:hypothetical protein [Bacillus sp. JCM 19041]|uniref:hypothetical protein n=1 Tax=Bacillus sp. JCM 19041 TaxID=1460637 RepID=UPI000B2C76E7
MYFLILFGIVFIIVFILCGIIDTLLWNHPSIKRWFLSSIVVALITTNVAFATMS